MIFFITKNLTFCCQYREISSSRPDSVDLDLGGEVADPPGGEVDDPPGEAPGLFGGEPWLEEDPSRTSFTLIQKEKKNYFQKGLVSIKL